MAERRTSAAADEQALFPGRGGGRLSARAIDEALRRVAARAQIALSAHVLRHTCLTGLVRAGHEVGHVVRSVIGAAARHRQGGSRRIGTESLAEPGVSGQVGRHRSHGRRGFRGSAKHP